MTQKPKGAYDAIELTLTEGETQPWESKCGGCPYLESEADYPRDQDGKPMMFLAQINLDEMPHVNKLPEQGLLQFYVSDKEMYGLDSPCRVIYIPEYKKDASVLLSKNPFEEAYENDKPYEGEGRYEFKSETDDWFSPGHLVGGEPFSSTIPSLRRTRITRCCSRWNLMSNVASCLAMMGMLSSL